MINDECDVVDCKNKATKEIEETDGENWFVCESHAISKTELKGRLEN